MGTFEEGDLLMHASSLQADVIDGPLDICMSALKSKELQVPFANK